MKLGELLRPYPVNISPKDLGLNINESRVRSITEKNTVRRARLKLIKISIFQHKTPATENSQMVNTGLASKP